MESGDSSTGAKKATAASDEYDDGIEWSVEAENAVVAAEAAAAAAASEQAAREREDQAARKREVEKEKVRSEQLKIVESTQGRGRGRLRGYEKTKRMRATAILADLDRDILPGERRGKKSAPLNQEEVLDRAAGTHAEHLAGPTMIEVVGRGGGARRSNASEGANAGAGGGSSGTAGGGSSGTAGGGSSGTAQSDSGDRGTAPPPGDDDSDDEVDGDEDEEDEDAARSYYYSIPPEAKNRLQQVKGQCLDGGLEKRQSPIFYPEDPLKAVTSSTLAPYLSPTVIVWAPPPPDTTEDAMEREGIQRVEAVADAPSNIRPQQRIDEAIDPVAGKRALTQAERAKRAREKKKAKKAKKAAQEAAAAAQPQEPGHIDILS